MLGHAGINSKDQIQDCTERGWVVLAIEHRLCPGVNVFDGPMTDVRDALSWAQNGGLAKSLEENGHDVAVDAERVMVMGTSSGGHLALSTVRTLLSWLHRFSGLIIVGVDIRQTAPRYSGLLRREMLRRPLLDESYARHAQALLRPAFGCRPPSSSR